MSRLGAGDEVLLRYRYADGSLQAALPMRVVEDSGDVVVAWLAPGTDVMYWATADGADPRTLPIEERFSAPLSTAPRRWHGNGVLRVMPIAEPYQVVHFWNDDGAFRGWYVNLEAPKTRQGARIDSVDWHLDLWLDADGTHEWKDEDEAAAALAGGQLGTEELDLARATGQRILDDLDTWHAALGDWSTFTPSPTWSTPPLPQDWMA